MVQPPRDVVVTCGPGLIGPEWAASAATTTASTFLAGDTNRREREREETEEEEEIEEGMGIRFVVMVNKQGQTRVAQYYEHLSVDERRALEGEIVRKCLARTDHQVPTPSFLLSPPPNLVWFLGRERGDPL